MIVDELRKLDFISSFFSWVFLLLSRLAEPCMLFSTMYIVIEAGIPQAGNAALHNLSVGIMITAPEIILPGAFVLAGKTRSEGKDYQSLYVICFCFVGLTFATLLSLFVFHFSQDILNFIMFLRCAAGIGYSILIRKQTYASKPEQQEVSKVDTKVETKVDTIPAETKKPVLETKVRKPRRKKTAQLETANITPITRKLVTDDQIQAAYKELLSEQGKVTADALRERAGIGKPRACQWLRENVS
jgi:hypothetical protein